eukprot:s1323_g9.t1
MMCLQCPPKFIRVDLLEQCRNETALVVTGRRGLRPGFSILPGLQVFQFSSTICRAVFPREGQNPPRAIVDAARTPQDHLLEAVREDPSQVAEGGLTRCPTASTSHVGNGHRLITSKVTRYFVSSGREHPKAGGQLVPYILSAEGFFTSRTTGSGDVKSAVAAGVGLVLGLVVGFVAPGPVATGLVVVVAVGELGELGVGEAEARFQPCLATYQARMQQGC